MACSSCSNSDISPAGSSGGELCDLFVSGNVSRLVCRNNSILSTDELNSDIVQNNVTDMPGFRHQRYVSSMDTIGLGSVFRFFVDPQTNIQQLSQR